jgi:hypothetical protein
LVLPESFNAFLPMLPENIGGDINTIIFHAIFWWFIFIIIERIPKGYFERGVKITKRDRSDLDQDVQQEEIRV